MQRLPPITDVDWANVNEFNRNILDDYITNSTELSPKTRSTYLTNLRIWFIWVKDNLSNKRHIEIKPLEFKRFQNWLMNRGCSSSDVHNKRAAVSALNLFIETYLCDEYPTFHNFINRSIKAPPLSRVNEKQPLTKDELKSLIEELERREDWQKVAYLKFTFDAGCRRAESRQILKDIVNSKPTVKTKTITDDDGDVHEETLTLYQTPNIRCKGKGEVGKVRKLVFGQDTMDAFHKWLSVRGDDDCPYMFVTKYQGQIQQAGETCFNRWASDVFTPIVGRRVFPHLLRSSRATQAVVEDGKDIKSVQKLLGHESSETTEIYVVRDESDDVDDLF